VSTRAPYILDLDAVGIGDVARVGGKNASLGELIRYLQKAVGKTTTAGAAAAPLESSLGGQEDLRSARRVAE
jgi:phosphoenolpyruvate synthase/pyruvate phosphate dikinase